VDPRRSLGDSGLARDISKGVGLPTIHRIPTTATVAGAAGDAVYLLSIPHYPERPVVGVLDWSCRPGLPRAVGELPVEFSDVWAMTVTDLSLWVNARLFERASSLHRFDISTPTQPTYMGWIVGSSSRAIESGGLLFSLRLPVLVIDPTIRDSIAVIGTIEVEESVQDLAHVPPYVAAISGDSISLFDISAPASPIPLGSVATAATNLEAGPNVVFALGDSLHVLDWRDRPSLATLAAIDIPGAARDASIRPRARCDPGRRGRGGSVHRRCVAAERAGLAVAGAGAGGPNGSQCVSNLGTCLLGNLEAAWVHDCRRSRSRPSAMVRHHHGDPEHAQGCGR